MSELHLKRIDERELDTVLAEDIDFTGELTFADPLMIKGKFQGEIKSKGTLYVGEEAKVEAQINAPNVSIRGNVKGNIDASSRIELYSTARVVGDLSSPEIVMEGGVKFNGKCTMPMEDE